MLELSGATRRVLLRGALAVGLSATAAQAADAELGRYLSSECTICHGATKSDATIPNIYGVSEARINDVLKGYRAKTLPNPVMQNVAGRLKDDEIAALAAYFATAKKPR